MYGAGPHLTHRQTEGYSHIRKVNIWVFSANLRKTAFFFLQNTSIETKVFCKLNFLKEIARSCAILSCLLK